ncbi:FtsK/SpoIIIE domain-containing protein [Cellulomonas alba]|uniref:FtsK/SpoIIIE domain-containing protein n=1 Tax=Cellulomonas alba TaxID=3053467 RepID=A0ABT7SKE0_9CELL|nr:FtsK/SpoIIIE domain-containing protein [Cellulomonas alba]MDM7856655.1 FtsK/SpoIIIE domain-containing protein [Cellulomonas alba]
MSAVRLFGLVLRRLAVASWNVILWTARAWRAVLVCLVIGNVLFIADLEAAGVIAIAVIPASSVVRAVWDAVSPLTYEAMLGAPLRRRGWRHRVRKEWKDVARRCGLIWPWADDRRRSLPRLLRVSTSGNTLTLRVRAAVGQTVDDLTGTIEAIATAFEAESAESRRVAPGVVELDLTMCELLHEPTTPRMPYELETEAVTVGRRADGSAWRLQLAGRHTLVVGRSGAGKGSVFWGVAGNLAPSANAGLVRLWGIDLKGGVELSVGEAMFSSVAIDEQAALGLLNDLHRVIVERQAAMRGRSREFTPSPGDPAHVLLIDELAVLTGYASRDVVNQGTALLKRILTQGRALGVMVVAFVQDPRKETVGMRELFTQTIALRVASASETRMVLGDGYGDLAPAHRIDRTMPGAGYVVRNDGVVERVRADFWSDELIRSVADRYPAAREARFADHGAAPGELLRLPVPELTVFPAAGRRDPRTPRDPEDPEAA